LENNLNPAEYLTPINLEFYVPIYDKQIKYLRHKILNSDLEKETLYVTGQVGTGKTTALQFIANGDINSRYDVFYLNFRELLDLHDIDIIDILLLFPFSLIRNNKPLSDEYFKKLDHLYKIAIGRLTETVDKTKTIESEASARMKAYFGVNFSFFEFGAGLLGTYRLNSEKRRIIRECIEPRKEELLKLTNEIIEKYYQYNQLKKKILAVFDDLEKIRERHIISKIFIDDRFLLESINCKKICTIPTVLRTISGSFVSEFTELQYFTLKVRPKPSMTEGKVNGAEQKEIDKNISSLKEIIFKRIDPSLKMITDEALVKAIEFSGGLIRQYIRILNGAVTGLNIYEMGESTVTEHDIDNAIADERYSWSREILGKDRILLLKKVLETHTPPEESDLFIDCLLANQIIAYPNRDAWYDVNPLIKETIKAYSQPLLNE